jgi:hypothetical protein
MTTLYYDPVLDVHHRLPVSLAMTTAYYAMPQHPKDSRRLFDAACAAMGLDRDIETTLNPSRNYGSAMVMAKEWGLDDIVDRLSAAVDASFEPTWDTATGEFTWGMGLGELYPRGQFNAFLAAAEAAGPGRWTALSAAPLAPCPQIVDVDFPNVAVTRAEWQGENLLLTFDVLDADPNAETEFRIVGVEPREWRANGIEGVTIDVRSDCVVVRLPRVAGDLEFTPSTS